VYSAWVGGGGRDDQDDVFLLFAYLLSNFCVEQQIEDSDPLPGIECTNPTRGQIIVNDPGQQRVNTFCGTSKASSLQLWMDAVASPDRLARSSDGQRNAPPADAARNSIGKPCFDIPSPPPHPPYPPHVRAPALQQSAALAIALAGKDPTHTHTPTHPPSYPPPSSPHTIHVPHSRRTVQYRKWFAFLILSTA